MTAHPKITQRDHAFTDARDGHQARARNPLRRRRRFVARAGFTGAPRTAPGISSETFRAEQDRTVERARRLGLLQCAENEFAHDFNGLDDLLTVVPVSYPQTSTQTGMDR